MYKFLNSRKGTSLVEIMATLAILVIGILQVSRMFSGGLTVLKRSENQTFAARLAEAEFERLRNRSDTLPAGIYTSNNQVVGETVVIPAPSLALGKSGAIAGAVYNLNFTPVSAVTSVYSAPLQRRIMETSSDYNPWFWLSDTQYAIDYDEGVVAFRMASYDRSFSITVSYWVASESGRRLYTSEAQTIHVPANTSSWIPIKVVAPNRAVVDIGSVEGFDGIDDRSEQVSRQFVRLNETVEFSKYNPYEYKVIDEVTGRLAFNPAGYRFKERTPQGMVDLAARVTYTVLDWSVVCDRLQVPDSGELRVKTTLRNIKQSGVTLEADGSMFHNLYPGYNPGQNNAEDVMVVDESTGERLPVGAGGIRVDYNNGYLLFPTRVATSLGHLDMAGRSVRVYYRAEGEWKVMVDKAYERLIESYDQSSLDSRQFFTLYGLNQLKLSSDARGKTFSVDYVYTNGNGEEVSVVGETHQASTALDGYGKAVLHLDHAITHVRAVRGLSLKVSVYWTEGNRVDANGKLVPKWQRFDLDGELARTFRAS